MRFAIRSLLVMAALLSLSSCVPGPATIADGQSRVLTIVNRGNTPVIAVYASPTGSGRANTFDLLGGTRAIRPGQVGQVNLDDGSGACVYDVIVRFAGYVSGSEPPLDICDFNARDRALYVSNDGTL